MVIHSSPFGSIDTSTTPVHVDLLAKIDQVIKKNPNKKAFVSGADPSNFLTYSDLKFQSYAVAQFLHNRGFNHQTACIVIPNGKEFFAFFLGVSLQGGAISGASALFTDFELERQFKDSRCSTVLTDEGNLEKVRKAVKGAPNVKTIIVIPSSSSLSSPSGTISWNEVISTPIDSKREPVKINVKDDVVLLPYSSGTTGSPKGVMLTHQNFGTMMKIFLKARHAVDHQTGTKMDWEKENMLLFLPFYHIYGFSVICYSILEMSTAVILSSFEPMVYLKCIQDYKISQLMLVPPILVFLAKHPICTKFDLSSIKRIASGAAPAGKDICDEVIKRYPNIEYIEQGYGMTELSTASHMPDLGSRAKFGSCGKLCPGLEMKIVHISNGEILPTGKAGEICVKGPTVMKGYLGRDEATRECIQDGWMHTGDIGYCDADGDLFIIDRLKELIKVKGLQVPPAELEDILLSHPSIQDAAVIGIPDSKAGELPKAYVVKSDPKLTAEQVYNFIKEKVSPYKYLNGGVEFIDVIPKSAAGKILRRMLRDKHQSKL
ncbi:acs-14 [Pristionchus pacificus]|nr:acs-14 [Pristionchus pacificus]